MRTRARGKEQKGKSTKEKPCKIYIFTEGDTEEIYLQHYDNKKKGIEVIPVDPKHTDAVGIVKYAKKYIDDNEVDVELETSAIVYLIPILNLTPILMKRLIWLMVISIKG